MKQKLNGGTTSGRDRKIDVATSGRGRDINIESEAVATSECKEKKVATSSLRREGRDISQRSRHH